MHDRLTYLEDDMTAVVASLFPRASATSIADIDSFATIALFSGLGLLLSLSVPRTSENVATCRR